jgi:signal transduction histidine kinase
MAGHHLATRGQSGATPFRASRPLGALYGGMTVEVSLAEALAPALLIGGVPSSRLPFLAVALALTLTLAAVGVVQLRQAAQLARQQQEFVAGTSHELRTPLAQIRLFA